MSSILSSNLTTSKRLMMAVRPNFPKFRRGSLRQQQRQEEGRMDGYGEIDNGGESFRDKDFIVENNSGVDSGFDDKSGGVGINDGKIDSEDEECAICQNVLCKPITLPCGHKFCSACLDGWRSKYIADKAKTCPMCRSKIPATREMIAQLKNYRRAHAVLKTMTPGDFIKFLYYEDVRRLRQLPTDMQHEILKLRIEELVVNYKDMMEDLEEQIGDEREILEEHPDDATEELPHNVYLAACNDEIEEVMNWLGTERPIPYRKINARNPKKFEMTLLHAAVSEMNLNLARILLQYGANVDAMDAFRESPLLVACSRKKFHSAAMLLLQWGADKDITNSNVGDAVKLAQLAGNIELIDLLKSPLGGRRCEILGERHSRTKLNGHTCVAIKYLPNEDSYEVRIDVPLPSGDEINNDEGNGDDNNGFDEWRWAKRTKKMFGDEILLTESSTFGNEPAAGFAASMKAPPKYVVKVKSCNLKRRDRKEDDPGVVVEVLGRNPKTNGHNWKWKMVKQNSNQEENSAAIDERDINSIRGKKNGKSF